MSLHRRLTFLLGFGQLITWALTYYIPAVTTGAVAAGLGVSSGAVLGGFSCALLATGLASPAACRLIDRAGGRPVLLGGIGLQVAGLLVMAASGGLVQWYAGWAVVGLGMAGGLYDAAFATAGRALGAEARPTITAVTMIGGFASTVGWPLGAALVPVLGWRMTLVAYAGLLLALNGPLYSLLPRVTGAVVERAAAARPAAVPGRFAFACMAAFFTLRGGISTVITISAPVLLQGLGLGAATAVLLSTLIGPAQVGMRVVQAGLGGRFSPLALTWLGAALLPLVIFPPVWAAGTWLLPAAAVFVVGYGMSNGILTIARGTLPLHLFGAEGYAVRIGQLALPVVLAQAAAPVLSGPALSGWPAAWVLLALGVGSVLAAACLVPLSVRRGPPR